MRNLLKVLKPLLGVSVLLLKVTRTFKVEEGQWPSLMGGVGEWNGPLTEMWGQLSAPLQPTLVESQSALQTPGWKKLGSGPLGQHVSQAQITHPC